MNKCLSLLVALCLLLCGCGAPPSAPAEQQTVTTTAAATTTATTTTVTTTTTTRQGVRMEVDGSVTRLTGEWRERLTPATEKEEQVVAYDILKKLRHKEKELGFLFSGTLLGHLQVEQTDYLLCEIGHWTTDASGGVSAYETVTHLMVPADLSAGFAATAEEDALSWDTADNWFKK